VPKIVRIVMSVLVVYISLMTKDERTYLNKQKRAEAEERARSEVEKWCD